MTASNAQVEDCFAANYAKDLTYWATDYLSVENPRLHEIYREMMDLGDDFFQAAKEEQTRRRTRYHSLVEELIAILGTDADVGIVDPWLFDSYSDCYKDDVGFRPRGHSYATAKAYMDQRLADGRSWIAED